MCDNPSCVKLRERYELSLTDVKNLEKELTLKRRQITRMQKELDDVREMNPAMSQAVDVFHYWVSKCRASGRPDQVKFGPARQKAVLGMLRLGVTPERIMRAIDGAAADPFIDAKGKVFDDLELICRNEVKLDNFIDRFEAAEKAGKTLSATEVWNRLNNYAGDPIRDRDLNTYNFRCICCRTPESLLSKTLVFVVKSDGLRMRCEVCNADAHKVRAELARRKRDEQALMRRMREEMAA